MLFEKAYLQIFYERGKKNYDYFKYFFIKIIKSCRRFHSFQYDFQIPRRY